MTLIRNICVYCGSGPGSDPAFVGAARTFGKILAQNGIGLVYGGGSIGLMGELANAVLDHGGKAIGTEPSCPPHITLRSFEGIVPKTVDWRTLGSTPARAAA